MNKMPFPSADEDESLRDRMVKEKRSRHAQVRSTQQIEQFQLDIKSESPHELERDLAEITFEVSFMEAQVKSEIGDYTPAELEIANEKIWVLKRKAVILKLEYESRKKEDC